jgi:hypothetical protein
LRALVTVPLVLLAGSVVCLAGPAAAADPLDPLVGPLLASPTPSASPSASPSPTDSRRSTLTTRSRAAAVQPARQEAPAPTAIVLPSSEAHQLAGSTRGPLLGTASISMPVPSATPTPAVPRPVVAAPAAPVAVAPVAPAAAPGDPLGLPSTLVGTATVLLVTTAAGNVLARRRRGTPETGLT